MTSPLPDSTVETGRGIGITALVLAIATPVAAAVGWLWTALTPGPGALGVAILALMGVAAVAGVAILIAIMSLFLSRPNILAKLSLVLVGATAVVLFLLIFPPNLWFA
jgi:hypothetical protein